MFGRLHVLPIVNELLRTYPEITARLVLSDRYANLVDDHFDVAVRIGELADSSLIATRVGSVRRVACASPAYLAAHGRPRRPADLVRHACIATTTDDWQFATTTIAIRPRLLVSTAEAAIDAARAGIGIARVLSYQLTDPSLVRVLGSHEPPPLPVQLVRTDTLVPRKLRVFLDLATSRLRAALSSFVRARAIALVVVTARASQNVGVPPHEPVFSGCVNAPPVACSVLFASAQSWGTSCNVFASPRLCLRPECWSDV